MSAEAAHHHRAVLELTVNHHAGALSHICGLFARRAFNLDGIVCLPLADGKTSRMWLRVDDDERLERVEKQLIKLHDVLTVRRHPAGCRAFVRLTQLFQA